MSLTIPQAAQHLGVSEKTVRNRIKAKLLPAAKVSGRWMIDVADHALQAREEVSRTLPAVERPPVNAMSEIAWADPLRHFVGGVQAYNPSALVARKGGLRIFRQIRVDDQVKAALSFKKHAVIASGWEVVSPEGKDEDWEPTKFVADQLSNMRGTFDDVVLGILTALDFGYSVSEKIFEPVKEGPWKGKIGLKAVKTREPESIGFDIDEFGNIAPDGILQSYRGDFNPARLPRWKFILWAHQPEFDNPYGTSDLESAYREWWVKDNGMKWLALLLERYGVPPIFGLYDPAKYPTSLQADLRTIFETLQGATSALIPRAPSDDGQPSLEMWAPELAGQVGSVFVPAFEMLDKHLARSILMPGMLSLTADEGGSLARAQVAFDVFVLVVDFVKRALAETINEEVVRDLVDLNFSIDERPRFRFMPIAEDEQADLLKVWGELVGLRVVLPTREDERHIRTVLKFPERDDEDELIEPPTPPVEEPSELGPKEPEEPEEPDDEEEPAEMVARHAARELTASEKAADFARITREADAIEARAKEVLVASFRELTDRLASRVPAALTLEAVGRVNVKVPPEASAAFAAMLSAAFKEGRAQVRDQLRTRQMEEWDVNFVPRKALEWLSTTAKFWVKNIGDELTKLVRTELMGAIKYGLHTRTAIERLRAVMAPFTGDPLQLGDPAQASAARVETIIRTNTTNALNTGRLVEARRVGRDLVGAMQFSAVLDERTTEVCRHLDGRVFPVDSPDLDRLTPPLHHNCRSILVPVTLDIEVDPKDYITAAQVGRAIEEAGKGFA